MYLILPIKEAQTRNCTEAKNRGCDTTTEWWDEIVSMKGDEVALIVKDGSGLSEEELADCVKVLPENFITEE